MRTYISLIAVCCLAPLLSARTVQLERVICNPTAQITVPLSLDNAQGLAVASVRVTWNPDILVLTSVEQGNLAEHFSFDFTVVDTPGSAEIISSAPANITAQVGGTLAEMNFIVREGSDALYSDLALTEVVLNEETMTQDLTVQQALTPRAGVVRSFATTSSCSDRFGEGALCVAKETQLEMLTLRAGDTLSISERQEPIIITDTLITDGTLRLRAPDTGWNGKRYEILRTTNTAVTFATTDIPENYVLSTEMTEGVATYVLTNTSQDPTIPVTAEVALSDADKDAVRALLANQLEGVTAISIQGTQEAIQVGLDLGIYPKISRLQLMDAEANTTLTAAFALPTLKIVAFDVKSGSVSVQVIPAEGCTITKSAITGVLHLHGAKTLAETMSEISNVEINVSEYLTEGTKGMIGFTLQLGDYSFFKVVVSRPSE